MNKVLVTGGAGYIGTFVVQQLLDKDYHVVVLDDLLYGDKGAAAWINDSKVTFIKGDICDKETVEKSLEGVSKVIALAAIVGDPACAVNEEITMKINYESVKLLIDLSIEKGIERFVFASSCSVYGSSNSISYLTEESELNPVSLYARTRIMCEDYLAEKKEELSFVTMRLSTVFGLSTRMRFDLAVNIMTAKALSTGAVDVFGGNQWRPFVHAQDVASAFVIGMEAEDSIVRGEVFNVGSTDSNYQIQDIATLIKEELPDTIINNNTAMVDARNYNVVFDKIHKRLNFKTNFSVRDGIREIIDFCKENEPNINNKEYSNYLVWKELGTKDVFLPYAVPDVGEDEKQEILKTMDSGWLSTGPKTRAFEEQIKEYYGDEDLEVIAVSSCTAGLHLQLLAAEIGPGDEVITSPLTFSATVNTILYTGATPVLVDIDPETYNIDLDKIEAAITDKTKAIVPVYYAGQAVDHDKLKGIADKHDLYILADAAHAFGARYKNQLCGSYEDAASFSFYATKNLVTGEGGIVTTRNKEWANKMRRLLSHGMNKDAWKRFSEKGSWYYEITDLGYKYNFTDVQAAMGIHQLRKIDSLNGVRRNYGAIYDRSFEKIDGVKLHGLDDNAYYTRHLYPVVIDEEIVGKSREQVINELKELKIGTSVHYVPIHYHSLYQKTLGVKPGDFPETDKVYKGLISLPLYSKMTNNDVSRVVKAFQQVTSK